MSASENAAENADSDVSLAPPSPLNGVQLRTGKGIGGKRGRSGRKPLDIVQTAEQLLRKPKARKALEAVITNPNHPHFAAVLRTLLSYRFGKPMQCVVVGRAQSVDELLLARAKRFTLAIGEPPEEQP